MSEGNSLTTSGKLVFIGFAALAVAAVVKWVDPVSNPEPSRPTPPVVAAPTPASVAPVAQAVPEAAPETGKDPGPFEGKPYEPGPFKGSNRLLTKAFKEIDSDDAVVGHRWFPKMSQLYLDVRVIDRARWGSWDGYAQTVCLTLEDWGVSTGVGVFIHDATAPHELREIGFDRCRDSDPKTAEKAIGKKWWLDADKNQDKGSVAADPK